LEELGDGNFAGRPNQKAGAAGQGFGVDVLEPCHSGRDLLFERVEDPMGVGHRVDNPFVYSINTIYE
jgi:hypothetical protein